VIDRRSAWSDPEVQALLASFVPTADEVGRLQRDTDPEARFFQAFAELGHYGGRERPTSTRQGIYVVTPSGKLLGSWNTRQVAEVRRRLRATLEVWTQLPESERYPAEALAPGARFEDHYPVDGLVLVVYSRDLPRVDDTRDPADWRTHAWNVDHVWFTAAEAASLAAGELDRDAARRLVRLHTRDNVRGQTTPFPLESVQSARLEARVVAENGATRTLELVGEARVSESGAWRTGGGNDMPEDTTRSFEGAFYGRAVWNGTRFTSFELALVGARAGATQYNERADDRGPAPMGVVFQLAAEDDRVAPAMWYEYPRAFRH
jgi:hypothetical protein